jgi:predicted acylesterase/phospholipase RssA
VAISGGGHRATLWGLGALFYLVDADKHREVAAISSVSGGSIANGVVAQEVDLPHTDAATFDAKVARLVRHIAHVGLFFWGPATNAYVLSLFALVALGLSIAVAGIVLLCIDGLSWRSGLTVLGGLVALELAARIFELRSHVVDRALDRTHFTRDGRSTRLSDVARSLDHVLCATELQSGEHVYLSPRFLYSYRLGVGTPADLKLSTAVQASACLPGAFSPRRLPTAPHAFVDGVGAGRRAEEFLLTDGGVYDNMADQWLDGLEARVRHHPTLPAVGRTVDEVVVVNGSSPVPWKPMRQARLVLLGELATLLRVNSVMYQVTTERRRFSLVHEWDEAQRALDKSLPGEEQRGALVHIAQSPYSVADSYRHSNVWPDRARRAQAVVALLGDDPAERTRWAARADASAGAPTVLRKLGRDMTLDLLEHAYVLAMCNLHVLLDHPLLPLPERDRFERLLA